MDCNGLIRAVKQEGNRSKSRRKKKFHGANDVFESRLRGGDLWKDRQKALQAASARKKKEQKKDWITCKSKKRIREEGEKKKEKNSYTQGQKEALTPRRYCEKTK